MRCRMICGSPIFLHFYWPLSHVKLRSLAAPWRTPQRSCPALRRGPSADPPPPLREEGRHRTGLGRRSPCRLNVQDGSDGSVAIRCLFKGPQLKPTGLITLFLGGNSHRLTPNITGTSFWIRSCHAPNPHFRWQAFPSTVQMQRQETTGFHAGAYS